MLLRRAADNPVKVLLANSILVWAGCCGQGIWTIPGQILDFLSHSVVSSRQCAQCCSCSCHMAASELKGPERYPGLVAKGVMAQMKTDVRNAAAGT
jgi:hypothetical protein